MKAGADPKALIHYSTSAIEDFNVPNGYFKTQTQGRVYALDVDNTRRYGVTKSIEPKSALLFTDKALEKFSLHTGWGLNFFKRYFGQYRSIQFGDLTWKQSDTVAEGDVLQIKDVEIVRIKNWPRRFWQRIKVAAVISLDIVVLLVVIAVIALSFAIAASLEQFIPGFETAGAWVDASEKWLKPKIPWILGVFAIFVGALLYRVSKKIASKNFETDLKKLGF